MVSESDPGSFQLMVRGSFNLKTAIAEWPGHGQFEDAVTTITNMLCLSIGIRHMLPFLAYELIDCLSIIDAV